MKRLFLMALMCLVTMSASACTKNNESGIPEGGENNAPVGERKILVVYFSWGGTTKRVADEIISLTGADVFRIEPQTPYPTEYSPCTEVAKAEKEADARPAIKSKVGDWEQYDTVFIGCPVWWWTAPMIINTFTKSYDFKGKTVIPFCTYAATYRDETLAKIVELTPESTHLTGFGSTGSTSGVKSWLQQINIIK